MENDSKYSWSVIILKKHMRITSLIISLTIIFSISGFGTAEAANDDFVVENGVLVDYTGDETEVTILDGVKEIGEGAFEGNSQLEKINIPGSVENIDPFAFHKCEKLKSVTLTDSVKKIGEHAFEGCSDLTYVNLPKHLDYLGTYAFLYCKRLVTTELPESVDTIGVCVFSGTSIENPVILNNGKLLCYVPKFTESYQIPNTVNEIAGGAFFECINLSSIAIPNSVKKIDYAAFGNCSSLLNVTIPASVTKIGSSVFTGTAIEEPIFINNGETLCYVPASTEEYTVSNQVTEIAGGAFRGCDKLKSVTLPDSLTIINDFTFASCSSLKTIKLPERLTSIGNSAFAWCDSLTLDAVPDSVTEIKDYAFWNCRGLSKFTIPGSVRSVGNHAFDSCSQLSTVVIENGVKSIGSCAFTLCKQLSSVSIPDSMREIGEFAFSDCYSLKTIIIPSSVTSLGNEIFFDTNVTVTGEAGSAIQSYCAKYSYPFTVADLSRDAIPTGSSVLLNGGKTTLEAYNIQGSNYFKLRDLAMALRETGKSFEVGFDASNNTISLTGGKTYTPVGGELSVSDKLSSVKAKVSSVNIKFNDKKVDLQAYNINGSNYFKLRDIAALIDFCLAWDSKTNVIDISTTVGYSA